MATIHMNSIWNLSSGSPDSISEIHQQTEHISLHIVSIFLSCIFFSMLFKSSNQITVLWSLFIKKKNGSNSAIFTADTSIDS